MTLKRHLCRIEKEGKLKISLIVSSNIIVSLFSSLAVLPTMWVIVSCDMLPQKNIGKSCAEYLKPRKYETSHF